MSEQDERLLPEYELGHVAYRLRDVEGDTVVQQVERLVRERDGAVAERDAAYELMHQKEREWAEGFKRNLRLGTVDVRAERDALRADKERLTKERDGAVAIVEYVRAITPSVVERFERRAALSTPTEETPTCDYCGGSRYVDREPPATGLVRCPRCNATPTEETP